MSQIEIFADFHTLAAQAAARFAKLAGQAIRQRGGFCAVLAGGSTPREMYNYLTKSPLTGQVDWRLVHLFWGDERCVPPDHPDSNYRMVNEALLSRVPLPSENVHRIPGEMPAKMAAQVYTDELGRVFSGETPVFDLVLLGLGEDGHTASLFPGGQRASEKRLAAEVPHNSPPPPLVDRVTLTLPVLNAARQVVFLVSGVGKAQILAKVVQGPYQPEVYPAQAVQPLSGGLTWFVDEEAAQGLD